MSRVKDSAPDYAGHSGAQWTYEAEETSDGYAFSVYDENGKRLTEPDISETNARLIAAAPELLEVLRTFAAHAESAELLNDIVAAGDVCRRAVCFADFQRAFRAIAKAERQP